MAQINLAPRRNLRADLPGVAALLTQIPHADPSSIVERCLDELVARLDADRGVLVLDLEGDARVVHARGPRGEVPSAERSELSRSLLRRARAEGDVVIYRRIDDEAPTASVRDFGIALALAAPLRLHGRPAFGSAYVDFRDVGRELGQEDQDLFRAVVALLSVVGAQCAELSATTRRLADARKHTFDVGAPSLGELLGAAGLSSVSDDIRLAVSSDAPLLVTGESGTGKTLLARAIAEASARRPVVRAMLGTSDDMNTIASELFGHEKGAFSGSSGRRSGLIEHADGGTLVLDEVLNLPLQAQQLLLDLVQFGTYRPLGWGRAEPKRASIRLVAVTNGDLKAAVAAGTFRRDLYFRLAALQLQVPPLRERRSDIPSIASAILSRAGGAQLSAAAARQLGGTGEGWEGNVRELEHCLLLARDRARLRGESLIEPRDLRTTSALPAAGGHGSTAERLAHLRDARARIDREEAELLDAAVAAAGGVVARAARSLGMARTTLAHRLASLGRLASS